MFESIRVNKMSWTKEKTIQRIIDCKLSSKELKIYNKMYYGRENHFEITVSNKTLEEAFKHNFEVAAYYFQASEEQTRNPRTVKVGLVQHSIVLPTTKEVNEQRKEIFKKVGAIIEAAAQENVRILCLQECWPMPFFFCTGEKNRWIDFAEDVITGSSTKFLVPLAKKHKMVIISPILEVENNVWWNTAVVIDDNGAVLGKHRKNHLPSVGSFRETSFYAPGNSGHPVFKTRYGNIAINICYGRHHALNWLMFGLNGAEIVFNPAATVSEFGETFWHIEARAAAVHNHFYTCSINRVGSETFTTMQNNEEREVKRSYYGSSYITAPSGAISPSLSRTQDGLLIAEVDLNSCRQYKDQWGFLPTARLGLYAEVLKRRFPTV